MPGESAQIELLAKISTWQPPEDVLRQVALDYDPRGVMVTLMLHGAYCTGLLPYGSSDEEVDGQLSYVLFRLYVILDEATFSLDLGPFVLDKVGP